MNKVYTLPPGENWVVDRFVQEWSKDNCDIVTSSPDTADVIWLLADWAWKQMSYKLLQDKKVITTVHHIVPEKFNNQALNDFLLRDQITNVYHVYNQQTFDFIKKLTTKRIVKINYWANQNAFTYVPGVKNKYREQLHLPINDYFIGSFQRDTEGAGIPSGVYMPKLEKGPDIFVDFIAKTNYNKINVHVILAGWRRQYIMQRFDEENIKYTYFDLPDHETLVKLYHTLDLYAVTSRCEGGPQSLIECGLLNVPVVSTPIGIADLVLESKSINQDVSLATPGVPSVENWKLPFGYKQYRDLILGL